MRVGVRDLALSVTRYGMRRNDGEVDSRGSEEGLVFQRGDWGVEEDIML